MRFMLILFHLLFKVKPQNLIFGTKKNEKMAPSTAMYSVASVYNSAKAAAYYLMPHFFVILTIRKITKATIMKVINATKKGPMPKICPA